MRDLQKMSLVYLSASNDKVDKQLAAFINCKTHDKTRLFFVRESQGVYRYNNKKVYMKIDKNMLMVKVATGYVPLEQFIQS